MNDSRKSLRLTVALLLISTGIHGCKDRNNEVKTYRTEKAPPAPTAPEIQQLPPAPPAEAGSTTSGPFAWDLPQGWLARPGSGMRLVTLLIPLDDKQVECSVIPLSGAAGGVVDNVNRWRRQIELPPVDAAAVEASAINAAGALGDFQYYKLINDAKPDKAFLAAILPGGERTLFVKVDAPAAKLDALESDFVAFCKSMRRSSP